jgi:superfamily II DNA or RNA helicase
MIFVRETAIYIHIEGDAKELSSLIEATKIRPPNYWRADSYQLYKMSGGKKGWDGYMKLIERSAAQAGKALRGLQDSVLEACKTLHIEVDKEKLIKSPFHGLVVDDVPDDLLVSDFELDGNQKSCIASWLNHGHGVHKVTVSGGKTAMFCAAAAMIKRRFPESRFLYLTPTERLINQVYRESKKFLPDWDITQFGGGKKNCEGKDMVVATAACMHANYDELTYEKWFRTFMTVLVDECFPAGTIIGHKTIESIKPGDHVDSWDGHTVVRKKVVRVFKNRPSSLVRVRFQDGRSVVCTFGHPILANGHWTPAINLKRHDVVMVYGVPHGLSQNAGELPSKVLYLHNPLFPIEKESLSRVIGKSEDEERVLFKTVCQNSPETRRRDYKISNMLSMPSPGVLLQPRSFFSKAMERIRVLFQTVSKSFQEFGLFSGHGQNKQAICVTEDEKQQSNETTGDTSQSIKDTIWSSVSIKKRWQWVLDGITKNLGHHFEFTYRGLNFAKGYSCRAWSKVLCRGHSQSKYKVGDRSGRHVTPHIEAEKDRPVEDIKTGITWVDSVEILEQGRDGKFGGLCPDGYVYNFEVEDTHTYFANGVLVHNCHHSSSESWQRILLSTPAFFRLGASDTTREDDVVSFSRIHGLVGPIRNRVEVDPLIRVGRVAKPTIYVVDNLDWKDRFSHLPHTARPESPAWVLIDNKWSKANYVGPVFEKAEPDKKTGDYKDSEEDGLKRDRKGELIPTQNMHHVQVDGNDVEIESRWCLLERVNDLGIIQFKERNQLIADWAKHFSDQGHPTLVVATRTLHILILQASISKLVKPELVKILFSTHDSKERDETFEWLKKTPGAVLITPLVKEGVSINEIRGGIVADHVVSHELMSQIIGRFIRQKKTGKNECEIVMFIDRQHPRLKKNGLALLEKLEKIRGYEYVFPVLGPDTKDKGTRYECLF